MNKKVQPKKAKLAKDTGIEKKENVSYYKKPDKQKNQITRKITKEQLEVALKEDEDRINEFKLPTICFLLKFNFNDQDGVYRDGESTILVYAGDLQHAVHKVLYEHESAFNFVNLTII